MSSKLHFCEHVRFKRVKKCWQFMRAVVEGGMSPWLLDVGRYELFLQPERMHNFLWIYVGRCPGGWKVRECDHVEYLATQLVICQSTNPVSPFYSLFFVSLSFSACITFTPGSRKSKHQTTGYNTRKVTILVWGKQCSKFHGEHRACSLVG